MLMHKLIEHRSGKHRWVYIACAVPALLLALVSVGEGGVIAGLIYLPNVALCALQFYLPTILAWFLLTAAFLACTVGVLAVSKSLTGYDFGVFLSVGLIPALALLWSWPKSLGSNERIRA